MSSPLPEDKGPTFEPRTHWCPKHLEPFRATWGKNAAWALATLALFEECIRRQEIINAAGNQTSMLDRVLREYSPLCCYLGDETTAHWTELALGPEDAWKEAFAELRQREAEA